MKHLSIYAELENPVMLYKNKCSYLYTNVYLKLKRIHTFRLRFLINDFWNCLCNSSDSGSLLSRCCAIKLVHQFWSGSVLVPKRHFWYWSGSGVMIINTSLYRSGLVSVCIWCNKVLVWFRTMSPFFILDTLNVNIMVKSVPPKLTQKRIFTLQGN